MSDLRPLVTVGIPTFNRASLIGRTLKSVLRQDYANIEIIISDNGSTDSTPTICHELSVQDARIHYTQRPRNVGATLNFDFVMKQASGEYFMWLGDDDYIDANYISSTLQALQRDSSIALASGVAKYYRGMTLIDTGRQFNVRTSSWWSRMVEYYWKVSDNGVFYGLMRTSVIRQVRIRNALGGDWLAIARVAAHGKIVMLDGTVVHRELGGASQTHAKTAKSLGLPRLHALFPRVTIAFNAFADVAAGGGSYHQYGRGPRFLAGALVFLVLLVRAVTTSTAELLVVARDRVVGKTTLV